MKFDNIELCKTLTLEDEINTVKQHIRRHARPKYSKIRDIVDDIMDLNGKMLRPLFTIVSAHFGEYKSDKISKLAASIEMLHMATLIHDDIVDEATMRRHRMSVQSKYGKDLAVYAGDFLLSKALTMLTPEDYNANHIKELARGIEKICESELIQYENRYHAMNVKNYLRVISGKTAALFAISMYVGSSESGCSEKLSKQLGRIGYELGIAFQIIDDILDFTPEQEQIGKTTLNDVKRGYYTLPVIYALQTSGFNPETSMDENQWFQFVDNNQGIEKSRVLAQKYTERAFNRISDLNECAAKECLYVIAENLLKRVY